MAKQQQRAKPPRKPPTHSIDLHGYRKSEGIKALTFFLDQVVSPSTKFPTRNGYGDTWVLVITGSGAHSPEGPTLRDAVMNLLNKRKMEYSVNRGKGSFTVNASSGIAFYEPPNPVDSKILLKETPEKIPALPKGPSRYVDSVCALVHDDDSPTLQEVVAIEKAITESRTEQLKVLSEEKREEHILKRAASMSLLELKHIEEEEQDMIERAVSMSLIENNWSEETSSDHDLQRALELSQKEFEPIDEELRMALEFSKTCL
jgi:hypothetical protein